MDSYDNSLEKDMPANDHSTDKIHPFSRMMFETLTDWVEGCLNDHIVYPEEGLDEDDYRGQRRYVLDEAEFEETEVSIFDKDENKLNGLPELLAGQIICNESNSGKRLGAVKVRMEIEYDLDDTVTTPSVGASGADS